MLVLSRKVGERIMIGDGVAVTVLEVSERRVRLGVIAPDDVPVCRCEARQRVQHEHLKPVPLPQASVDFDVFA